jgi:integrase
MADITRKRERERLPARREPYWQRLGPGAQLGFRRGPDTWVCKYRDRAKVRHYKALEGVLDYDEARATAEAWLSQMGSGVARSARRGTVKDALDAYLEWLREQGRTSTADENEARFKLCVYSDSIADLRLEDATGEHFREWRQQLREGRQARSVNRHVRAVIAGLNRSLRLGYTGTPQAWQLEALADDAEESGETAVFLTPEQRAALIKAAVPALATFLRGLEHTGARPGELAAATVSKFDAAAGTLTLYHRKGRPAKLRPRQVAMSTDGKAFFAGLVKSKLPAAYLFTDPDSLPWHRHVWSAEFRAALAKVNKKARGKARVPARASAYSFRHARISELLQVHGIDPLTVAAQTGTSLAMIEKAYFKFIASAMVEKLDLVKGKASTKSK